QFELCALHLAEHGMIAWVDLFFEAATRAAYYSIDSPWSPDILNAQATKEFSAREDSMATWQPDPSFYPSPRLAAKAPPEKIAYVAAFDPERKSPDTIAVVDVDPSSQSYSRIVNTVAATHAGDEFHHFGWNACSSCLCPNAPHPHVERRYLVVPGLRS